jgi:hypothetical protein
VTLGSCDSPRIARPGRFAAPRVRLLLGLLGATVGIAVGCVDQTLIPVERLPTTGGSGGAGSSGLSGTSSVGDAHNGGAAGVGGQSCVAKLSNKCGGSNGCCAGILECRDGKCCSLDYDATCTDDSDCCTGACNAVLKVCVTPPGVQCTPANSAQSCKSDSNCCSDKCDLKGTQRCLPIEGCSPIGEFCLAGSECCTGICSGLCQPKPDTSVLTVGEICDQQNGGCSSGVTCAITPEEDITRCNLRTTIDHCTQFGGACLQSTECCRSADETYGHCLPPLPGTPSSDTAGKYGLCQECRKVGQYCKSSVDCCGGNPCSRNACVSPNTGSGGTNGSGGATSSAIGTCAAMGQTCAAVSTGSGGAGNSGGGSGSTALDCCSGQGLVCDQTQSPPRCAARQ